MHKIYVPFATCALFVLTTFNVSGQATFSLIQNIMQAKCGNAGCHGGGTAQIFDVDASTSDFYNSLVNVNVANTAAAEKGNKIVDPGHPYNSFLVRKIGSNNFDPYITIDAAERGSHPFPLQDVEIELIRQWVLAGAPETGNVVDYQLLQDYYTNGGIEFIPVPPAPAAGKGFQVRYGPIFYEPNAEVEIMKKEHLKNTDEIRVSRMEGYMSWESHHMLLFRLEGSEVNSDREGMRRVPPAFPFNAGVLTGMWQNDGDFKLPKGTAFYWPAGTVLDFDYHVKNYSQTEILPADFYMNIYYNEDTTPPVEMFATLDNQTLLALDQGLNFETRDHEFNEDRYLWLITSHTHKYAKDFDIFLREPNGTKGNQIYEGWYDEGYAFNQGFYDYQHPPNRYFEPMKKVDNGFVIEAKWDVTGPCTSPLYPLGLACVTFGLTTDDEMMLFSYLYTKTDISQEPTGIDKIFEIANFSVAPNPFGESTRIDFAIDNPAAVKLEVFDMLGKKIGTITEGQLGTGAYSEEINSDLVGNKSGVYFVTLSLDGNKLATRKISKL